MVGRWVRAWGENIAGPEGRTCRQARHYTERGPRGRLGRERECAARRRLGWDGAQEGVKRGQRAYAGNPRMHACVAGVHALIASDGVLEGSQNWEGAKERLLCLKCVFGAGKGSIDRLASLKRKGCAAACNAAGRVVQGAQLSGCKTGALAVVLRRRQPLLYRLVRGVQGAPRAARRWHGAQTRLAQAPPTYAALLASARGKQRGGICLVEGVLLGVVRTRQRSVVVLCRKVLFPHVAARPGSWRRRATSSARRAATCTGKEQGGGRAGTCVGGGFNWCVCVYVCPLPLVVAQAPCALCPPPPPPSCVSAPTAPARQSRQQRPLALRGAPAATPAGLACASRFAKSAPNLAILARASSRWICRGGGGGGGGQDG